MIYYLYCALSFAGGSVSLFFGSYMMYYTGAHEIDLGYLFMILPVTYFLRPLVCAQADRYQNHKQLFAWGSLIYALSQAPFIVVPYLCTREPDEVLALTGSTRCSYEPSTVFWILTVAHLIGSVAWCCVRAMGDALAVNYAKRVGTEFSCFRKWGSISFGSCAYLLGYVNQGSDLLPDFVASYIVCLSCNLLMAVLIYLWPDEFFKMRVTNHDDDWRSTLAFESANELPNGRKIVAHMANKLFGTLCCCCKATDHENQANNDDEICNYDANLKYISPRPVNSVDEYSLDGFESDPNQARKPLTFMQQLRIFLLLIRRDFRIPLYLLTILYGGLVGYAGPNFVFTYMNKVCHEKGTCDAAKLAGLTIITSCTVETLCYMVIDKFGSRFNKVAMFQTTLISLTVHYYFYGFILEHVSPYFFLLECLHGLEYSIALVMSIDLGYTFGSQVELLIPELITKGIIKRDDDLQLVRVALMATMSGITTLVYDGFGCMLGSYLFGQAIGHLSFTTTWILIGSSALIGFIVVLLVYAFGKYLGIEPQIVKTQQKLKFIV